MSIVDDETLQMYIEESKEHLESIESDLLTIEKGGAEIDEDLVNKVFRAAHSIKGGGGFLGLDNIKELAHKIENILDMVRNFQMVPTPDVINAVLVAFDRLGELLDDVLNSNELAIDDHLLSLKSLITDQPNGSDSKSVDTIDHGTEPPPAKGPSFEISSLALEKARKGGNNLYILEFDLRRDTHLQDIAPPEIIMSLEEAGKIIEIQNNLSSEDDMGGKEVDPDQPMYVLYASIVESDLIGSLFDLKPERITYISEETQNAIPGLVLSDGTDGALAPIEAKDTSSKDNTHPEQPTSLPPKAPARKQPARKPADQQKTTPKSESLRVSVSVLDQLMNRAGELVLARNELLQAITGGDKKIMIAAGQRMDLVTSELQEAIMLTRMQPVGNIFNKFSRVVRDMSRDLSKEMELTLEGNEVELDKTIIEGLADPLTHLVRNSCDHGIELPEVRLQKGKPAQGRIDLRAFHESGQVIIEIVDDGKGLDPEILTQKAISKGLMTEEEASTLSDKDKTAIIMLPGFSTAEQVTEVSGRGVGMDVVKTNLDKLGGQVELISELDKGTTVRIKLPLTLAIIPCLLVSSTDERFALPQVNVGELLRIPANEIREKIEKIGGADVLILRGELIPLLQLNNVLELTQTYYDSRTGEFLPDRRGDLSDMRLHEEQPQPDSAISDEAPERRSRRDSDVSIVILHAGSFKFGLVVDAVHDTIEIVVKPLGRHLKNCEVYAGATIMGDGHVALILDVVGLARVTELSSVAEAEKTKMLSATESKAGATRQTLLIFQNGPDEYCSVPLHLVLRVEQIKTDNIEIRGGKKVIQYRGGNLPVYALEEVANVEMLEERNDLTVVIFVVAGHEVGLLTIPPLDVVEEDIVIDENTLTQPGISGSAIIAGRTTLIIDIFGFIEGLHPEWFEKRLTSQGESGEGDEQHLHSSKPILLAEDSQFFRSQIKHFLVSEGYTVVEAEDGKQAWDYLNQYPDEIGLVVTDLEMPVMDGFEFTKLLKNDERFAHLKVIALTSLAGEEDREKGKEAGIDDYQIKLDKEKLLQGIYNHLHEKEIE